MAPVAPKKLDGYQHARPTIVVPTFLPGMQILFLQNTPSRSFHATLPAFHVSKKDRCIRLFRIIHRLSHNIFTKLKLVCLIYTLKTNFTKTS